MSRPLDVPPRVLYEALAFCVRPAFLLSHNVPGGPASGKNMSELLPPDLSYIRDTYAKKARP